MKATIEAIQAIGTDYDQLATTTHGGDTRVLICESHHADGSGYYIGFTGLRLGNVTGQWFAETPNDALTILADYGLTDADWQAEDADR